MHPAAPGPQDEVRRPGEASRVVVDEDDGGARQDPFRHGAVQFGAGGGVESGPGLVQDEQVRCGEQRLGDGDLLAGALGEFGERGTGVVRRPEPGQPLPRPQLRLGAPQSVDPAEVDEVAGGGQGQRGREALGDVRRAAPAAGDPPLGGGVDPGEQPQQGRLPGAVAPFDPDEGPRGQREVDPAQHPGAAEAVPVAHTP